MTPVAERLKSQLQAINKLIGRDYSTDLARNDRIVDALVSFLIGNGTENVLDIKVYENAAAGLRFFFDQKSGRLFKQPDPAYTAGEALVNNVTIDAAQGLFTDDLFTIIGWDGRWSYYVFLKFTPDGYPVFFTATTDAGSDWVDVRTGLIFIASVVVSFAIPGFGAAIGSAVMGAEAAAAYPLIASAIGNACVSTVLNGGDVKSAAVGAVAGAAGGGVGGVVASATDSAMIGTAAAAATKALLTGGDLEKAVAGALVSYGASNAGSIISKGASTVSDLFAPDNSFTTDGGFNLDPLSPTAGGVTYDYTFGDSADLTAGFNPGVSMFDPLYQPSPLDDGFDLGYTAPDFSQPSLNVPNTPSGSNVFSNSPIGGDDDSWLADITGAAMAALKVYTVFQQTQHPTVNKAVTRTANGSTVTANANGTVTTRAPNGSTTVSRPAVGAAFVLSNGNTVVNNGDGTFSTVTPAGIVTTARYPAQSAGASGLPSWAIPAAGGLALLLLLK